MVDYLKYFGHDSSCSQCGQGGQSGPILPEIRTFANLSGGEDKYCSKCGESLWTECSSCKGTGMCGGGLYPGLFINKDNYCSECGRELDDKCSDCNGKGEVYENNHYLFCPRRHL